MNAPNINLLFQKAKDEYNQSLDKFYVSSKNYKGMHPAVLPPRSNYKFSEYVFGNPQDMIKIAREALDNGTMKSFYCSLCAIQEPDNLSVLNPPPCSDLIEVENIANKVKSSVTVNDIKFLITGTVPQYYYNHLLVITENHYNTYSVFMDYQLFEGVFKLNKNLTDQNDDVKFVFNGNFGSDRWHFHCHATNQKIGFVENAIKDLNLKKDQDVTGKYGIVKYRLLGSTDLKKLFERAELYTNIYYTPEYQSGRKYLSAIFKVLKGSYYTLFLLTGIKQGCVLKGASPCFGILPSAILNIGGTESLSANSIKDVVRILSENSAYEYIQTFTPPKEKLPYAELFEKDYSKNCQEMFSSKILDTSLVKNIFTTVRGCASGPHGCSGDNLITFATYKYIISMLFICLSRFNYHKGLNLIEAAKKAYGSLVSDQIFLDQAVQSSIGYLTHTYNMQSSKNIFLKGPMTAKILEKSFNNFSLITSRGDVSNQTRDITKWVEYNHPPVAPGRGNTQPFMIGEPSAMGAIVQTHVKTARHLEFVLKANKRPNSDFGKMFIHEFAVGMKLNQLRDLIPNFVITLGGFSCMSDPTLDKLCDRPVRKGVDAQEMQYIMLEYIEGQTFKKYMSDPSISIQHIISGIAQVSLGLLYSQEKVGFTHYDLHTDNVLVSNVTPAYQLPSLYVYKIGKEEFKVPAFLNCTFIDYGDSHVEGMKRYYELPGAVSMGKTSSKYNQYKDIFSFVIHACHIYCITHSEKQVYDMLANKSNHLGDLFRELLKAYDYLFIEKAREFIYEGLRHLKIFQKWDKDPKRDFMVKFMETKPLFNNIRTDNHYYLYLPLKFQYPTTGPYKSQYDFTKYILKKIDPISTGLEYKWGDGKNIGCQVQEPKSQKVKIQNVKNLMSKIEK